MLHQEAHFSEMEFGVEKKDFLQLTSSLSHSHSQSSLFLPPLPRNNNPIPLLLRPTSPKSPCSPASSVPEKPARAIPPKPAEKESEAA